jgi:serine protease Do
MEMLKSAQSGRRRPLRVAVIALSSAAVGALAVGMTPVGARNPPVAAAGPVPQSVAPAWPGYADLVEKVMPAVVSVTTKSNVSNALVSGQREFQGNPERFGRGAQPFEGMPFGGMPRGFGPRGEMPMARAGTGVILSEDGHIATNNHVVDGAER